MMSFEGGDAQRSLMADFDDKSPVSMTRAVLQAPLLVAECADSALTLCVCVCVCVCVLKVGMMTSTLSAFPHHQQPQQQQESMPSMPSMPILQPQQSQQQSLEPQPQSPTTPQQQTAGQFQHSVYDEIYELARYSLAKKEYSSKSLLMTDPHPWVDASSNKADKASFPVPAGWRTAGDWEVALLLSLCFSSLPFLQSCGLTCVVFEGGDDLQHQQGRLAVFHRL